MAKKILVIEDDDTLRSMFQSMLEKADYNVATAEHGEIGLKKVKEFQPDLIVLDILMPVMDGYEVLRNLKSEGKDHIPVIVLTSLEGSKEEEKSRLLGANDFLRKDRIHLKEIIDKVNNLLENNNKP